MKVLNRHHDNYIFVMLLVFVVLPILLAISTFFSIKYREDIMLFSYEYFEDINFGIQLLSLFQYGIFAVMLILYPIYPAAFSIERYFMKRKCQRSALREFEILRKIVYALFPFFIFAFVYLMAGTTKGDILTVITNISGGLIPSDFLAVGIGVIFFIVASALLKIIVLITRSEFRYYFSKVLFRVIPEKNNESEKMRLLVKALDSYNKYLRRSIGLEISEIKTIYSKILSDSSIDRNSTTKNLSIAFEDRDKFNVIRCLSNLLGVKDMEHFLSKESIGKKIGDGAAMLATMVSTIAAIIGVLSTLGILEFPK